MVVAMLFTPTMMIYSMMITPHKLDL